MGDAVEVEPETALAKKECAEDMLGISILFRAFVFAIW
jgi:hypothetical protein